MPWGCIALLDFEAVWRHSSSSGLGTQSLKEMLKRLKIASREWMRVDSRDFPELRAGAEP